MMELTLPGTPEGKAAAREVIDALDAAQVDYEAWEEDDGSVSFDFDESDQQKVLSVMQGLGVDVEPTREDDPSSGDPLYRTESLIESVMRGCTPDQVLAEGMGMAPSGIIQAIPFVKKLAQKYVGGEMRDIPEGWIFNMVQDIVNKDVHDPHKLQQKYEDFVDDPKFYQDVVSKLKTAMAGIKAK